MQIVLAILLGIVALVLFLAKKTIKNEDLERAANIGGVIATFLALIVLAFYTASLERKESQVTSTPLDVLNPTPTSTSLSVIDPCENMKSKVFVGEKVYAANKLDTNLNIRKVPSLSGPIVGSVRNGAEFLVISGPVCVDDIMWWEATTIDGRIKGWIAEVHSNGAYYILPTE